MSRHKSMINRVRLFRVRGSQNSWAMSRYSFHRLKSSLDRPEMSLGGIELSCFYSWGETGRKKDQVTPQLFEKRPGSTP
jgi:hypothetical protein